MQTKRMLVVRDANVQNNYGLKGSGVHTLFAGDGAATVVVADPASLVPGSAEERLYYVQDKTGLWTRLLEVIAPEGTHIWTGELGVPGTSPGLWVKMNRLAGFDVASPAHDRMFSITIPATGAPTIKEV